MNVSYVYNTNQIIYFEEDIFKFNYISPLGIGFNRKLLDLQFSFNDF